MIYLFLFVVGLNIADIVTTYTILKNGGKEVNPIIKKIMNALGVVWGLILVKSCVLTLLFVVTFIIGVHWLLYIAYVLLIVLYGWVVVHNFKNIK
jgi:flagellar biosynthesis component FlhA